MRRIVTILIACAAAHAGAAQNHHAGHDVPPVPMELLERPVTLRRGIGELHHPAAAASPEGQRLYDQGLAYLHNYAWIEAARSFNEALRLDSRLVLARVGLSVAYVELNHPAAAQRALEAARALAPGADPHDRVHVAVRERQFAAERAPQDPAALAAYRLAIDDALRQFPSDVELWLSRGIAEAGNAGDRGQSSTPAAIPFYEKALGLRPGHFAAHHYLAHAHENAGRSAEALEHGAAYARLAASIPHARHMHGHALRRAGRMLDATAEFEAADSLHAAYLASERVAPEHDWHYAHNLDLLGTSYAFLGQMRKAGQALERSFALPSAILIQAFNKREWPMFLRARGRHADALAAAARLSAHPNPVVQAAGRIEAGHSHLAGGNRAQAAAEANAAISALRSARIGAGLATLPLEALQGEFYLRAGPREKGRQILAAVIGKAVTLQGPDEWAQALLTLELMGGAARDAGDWELAGRVARTMLEHHPAYAGSHYAAGLVAIHAGDRRAARSAFVRAETAWARADPDLGELREVRTWLKNNPP